MNGLLESLKSMYAHDAIVLAGIENGSVQGIPLSQGKIAIVDAEDYEWLNQWKWSARKSFNTFYAERKTYPSGWRGKSETVLMHRRILGLLCRDGKTVDHKDRNGLNNQRANLRIVSKELNGYNCEMRSHNTSGYRGVSFHKKVGKWAVKIRVHTVLMHCGYYINLTEAAKAYDKAAIYYRKKDAILNFPEENT